MSTENSENVLLRTVFNFAAMHDWIVKEQIPLISQRLTNAKRSKDDMRRPGLTRKEMQHLLEVSAKRLGGVDERVYHQRYILHIYIMFMAYTGMRPFEALRIRWCDVTDSDTRRDEHGNYVKVRTDGKGDRERWLIPLDGFEQAYDDLSTYIYYYRMKVGPSLFGPDYDGAIFVDDPTPLLVDHKLRPMKSMSRGLTALMKAADLYYDPKGKRRDAYCLRHYYATERILAGVSNVVLAENMGTSPQMIDRHYSHLNSEMAAEELTKPGLNNAHKAVVSLGDSAAHHLRKG